MSFSRWHLSLEGKPLCNLALNMEPFLLDMLVTPKLTGLVCLSSFHAYKALAVVQLQHSCPLSCPLGQVAAGLSVVLFGTA